MEANEIHEMHEHAEHAEHDSSMKPVAITMAVLAVVVSIVGMMGHRAASQALMNQANENTTWAQYDEKKILQDNEANEQKMLAALAIGDKDKAAALQKDWTDDQEWLTDKKKELTEKAEGFHKAVEQAEVSENHFDLGEALLEIGIVITSVTLLTKQRMYWFLGLLFAAGGIVSAVLGLIIK